MPTDADAMRDTLAAVTSDLDQTQAMIDDARRIFDDEDLSKSLDEKQAWINALRAEIRIAHLKLNQL